MGTRSEYPRPQRFAEEALRALQLRNFFLSMFNVSPSLSASGSFPSGVSLSII
jgi:hypothetical protein